VLVEYERERSSGYDRPMFMVENIFGRSLGTCFDSATQQAFSKLHTLFFSDARLHSSDRRIPLLDPKVHHILVMSDVIRSYPNSVRKTYSYYSLSYSCTNRVSSVGIATGYGLEDRGVGVRAPVGLRISTSPYRAGRLLGPRNPIAIGYWRSFDGGRAVGAWVWPLTTILCRGQETMDLYIISPIRLHGVVLS
jgi:hypothetical protein